MACHFRVLVESRACWVRRSSSVLVGLELALRRLTDAAVQAHGHALLHVLAEGADRLRVVVVREPDFQANDVGRPWARQLVHEADTSDHVGRFDSGADHPEHKIVPVLVHLATTDARLQLELKMAPVGVHLVLPLRADVLAEDHDGVDDVEAVGLLADHALLLEQFGGLGHVVPELPKGLDGGEGGHLVGRVGVRRALVV
mmetsp:Transcript_7966/g.18242  ORF Transcript_7966/g.18242 Transcript_7966/m.18242 type:complete len:200 (+) Transcript_7966:130-729(+)